MPGSNKTPRIRIRLSSSAKKVTPSVLTDITNLPLPLARNTSIVATENEQLRRQVASLEKENEELRVALYSQNKRSLDTASNGEPSKKARTTSHRRKLFKKWAKSVLRESAKVKLTTYDSRKTFTVVVKEPTPWSKEDFDAIFEDKGQCTPENKPTQLTTIRFESFERVQELFGGEGVEIERTGYEARAMKKPLFDSWYKAGRWDAMLQGMEIHYNSIMGSLQLQFVLVTGNSYHE
ncbi:expressed unknown protein [Seminavis robusta]|uniref:Uncharacterized protein n=1 Tax=Seminavis robusta TaxID=568900 RepID=A0A9N8DZW7_9STRA|nr:expressed unknown protein [Seminavis robusta]|eukprot:Sro508_g156850.1 n/a (236) ;mRNA; r:46854-47561